MKLSELLEGIDHEVVQGETSREISAVVYDSRKVTKGCLFICIEGANNDGHAYAVQAAMQGAAAVVVQKAVQYPQNMNTTFIKVDDSRYAMAFISAAWFGHPADKLRVIGVTGTKGKTTTTYLIKSILDKAGHKAGLVGTIEIIIGDRHIHAVNTTPESYLLEEYFADMVKAGCDCAVMEVSSQGLKLHRTQGFIFDYGVFTNLEADHIGPNEHADMNEYMACKGLLFRQCRIGIANSDDIHMNQVMEGHTCKLETFGIDRQADLMARDLEMTRDGGTLGTRFHVAGSENFDAQTATPGKFSVYNALAAIAVCRHFDIPASEICEALKTTHVRGRIEPVHVSDDFTLIIDYAHNAMALESLMSTLRAYHPHRIICLFGCGGNRSKLRRFEMGEISGKMADLTIITSDNPRCEDPEAIIGDIKTGIERTSGKYITICDRKEAIAYAIAHGEPGDIIVLAGKGHEDYQEINGVKYHMDERELISDILGK